MKYEYIGHLFSILSINYGCSSYLFMALPTFWCVNIFVLFLDRVQKYTNSMWALICRYFQAALKSHMTFISRVILQIILITKRKNQMLAALCQCYHIGLNKISLPFSSFKKWKKVLLKTGKMWKVCKFLGKYTVKLNKQKKAEKFISSQIKRNKIHWEISETKNLLECANKSSTRRNMHLHLLPGPANITL